MTRRLPFDRYARAGVQSGVVHLGLGAFHRAHQAPVFDDLIAGGDRRWGVTGVAMRSPEVVQALGEQHGLFSLAVRGEESQPPRVIGALRGLLIAARQRDAVVGAIAAPATQLVTLTITEKGYVDQSPAGAMGIVAAGIAQRYDRGLGPITVMSCDNRAGNGPFTRAAVLAAGAQSGLSEAVLRWIEDYVTFPSTMVDRITPATTPAMIDASSAALGVRDEAAVWTEPFWQWVIENDFADARPHFAAVGATMVDAVAPWEDAKLRLLNAAHSALAYRGLLGGFGHVHEAVADGGLRGRIEALWDEAAATLDGRAVDIPAYRAALLRRFANPALPHALIQIAGDGSQKLPPRIVATMVERHERGLASPALAWAVAGWILALREIEGLKDPMLDRLRDLARSGAPASALLSAIGVDADPAIAAQVEAALNER